MTATLNTPSLRCVGMVENQPFSFVRTAQSKSRPKPIEEFYTETRSPSVATELELRRTDKNVSVSKNLIGTYTKRLTTVTAATGVW